eukprot:927722-Pyramimonas_sp.AAC.1
MWYYATHLVMYTAEYHYPAQTTRGHHHEAGDSLLVGSQQGVSMYTAEYVSWRDGTVSGVRRVLCDLECGARLSHPPHERDQRHVRDHPHRGVGPAEHSVSLRAGESHLLRISHNISLINEINKLPPIGRSEGEQQRPQRSSHTPA